MSNNPEKILIEIDPDLFDLVPDYLERRHQEVIKLHDILSEQDWSTLQRLAHDMKGSGSAYGFDILSEIGQKLEQAAKQNDLTQSIALVTQLESVLAKIEIKEAA